MTTFYVTKQVYFTFKVDAEDPIEACDKASELGFDDAYEYVERSESEVSERRESIMCD